MKAASAKTCLVALTLLALTPRPGESQAVISGRLAFKPQVGKNTSVDAQVKIWDGKDLYRSQAVEPEPPYRFSHTLDDAAMTQKQLRITVVVNHPTGYLTEQPDYRKRAGSNFFEQIRVRQQKNVYYAAIQRGTDPERTGETRLRYLHYATTTAATPGQQFEANRKLAEAYGQAGDDKKRVEVLEATHASGTLEGLGPARRQTYWSERLDAILEWAEYGVGKVPAETFATKVADPQNKNLGDAWQTFVKDFGDSYPETITPRPVLTPKTVGPELKAITHALGRSEGGA